MPGGPNCLSGGEMVLGEGYVFSWSSGEGAFFLPPEAKGEFDEQAKKLKEKYPTTHRQCKVVNGMPFVKGPKYETRAERPEDENQDR